MHRAYQFGRIEKVPYTEGKYVFNNLILKELTIFSTDYQTLLNSAWLGNNIIDAGSLLNEKYWNNTIIVPSSQTYFIFDGNLTSDNVGKDWSMFTVEFFETGNILMPVLQRDHWISLMINVDEKTLKLIDPINRHPEDVITITKDLFLKLVNYINICKN